MLIGILIVDGLSLLIMIFMVIATRRTFAKRRYLFCKLRHQDHSPEDCTDVPIDKGPLKTYLFLNLLLIFLSFFVYYSISI